MATETKSEATTRVCAVVGVGPGLGNSLAWKFSNEGYAVALLARSVEKLTAIQKKMEEKGGKALAIGCDVSNLDDIHKAFETIKSKLGPVEVLCYNVTNFVYGDALSISPQELDRLWKVGALGCFASVREVLPDQLSKKKGTILITGATASMRGTGKFIGLSVPKFSLRSLSQSLAREYGPQGIHVAHFIIDGQIRSKEMKSDDKRPIETLLDPDAIADTYFHVHSQPKSAWTQELDLRPDVEKW